MIRPGKTVIAQAASTASSFIWSYHPSRQLKISHYYLECYHFKNLIMGMPKTGHNFVYRNRVCSQLYRGCGHSLSSLPLSGSSEKKDYTTTIPIYYYTRRLLFFFFSLVLGPYPFNQIEKCCPIFLSCVVRDLTCLF